MAKVEIYTINYCPFCARAKRLLERKGVAYEELDVTGDPQLRAAMVERADGKRTVPEIFINGRIVGGAADLQALEDAGELDTLLAES